MLIELADSDQLKSLLLENELVLLDFYANWCEPCKWLDSILEEVDIATYKNEMLIKIDIEKYPELAETYQIKSVPVVCIFNKQQLVWRINGFITTMEFVEKINAISRGTK